MADCDSETIAERRDKESVTFAGIVSGIREVTTRRKDIMAYVTIEDMKGSVNAIAFSDVYRTHSDLFHEDSPVFLKGTLDVAEDSVKVILTEARPLAEVLEVPYSSVHFVVDATIRNLPDIDALRQVLGRHRGKYDGYLHIVIPERSETVVYLGHELRLSISEGIKNDADAVLGAGSTKFN